MSKYFFNKKVDAVILCGGFGSRLKKISKGKPKSLIKINQKNILSYIINELKKYNFNKIYLLIGYKAEKFLKYETKKYNFISLEYIREKKPMGTGGALFGLKKKNINDFILLNGDSLFPINYVELQKVAKNKIGSIGITKNRDYKSNNKLNNLDLNKQTLVFNNKSQLMNGGVYFFKKKFLKLIKNKIFSLENDLIEKLIQQKKLNGLVLNSFFLDIGTIGSYTKSPALLKKNFERPAVFLDRDGVVNFDKGYVHKYKNFVLRPGVIEGLKLLTDKNYLIFIVTNQAGIAKNYFRETDLIKLHLKIKNSFLKKNIIVNDVIYCPHHPEGLLKKYKKSCSCRKPNNGMIKKILKNYDIKKLKSFMIGDKKSDKLCAKKSNLYFEYAGENFYLQIKKILKKKINE